MKSTFYRRALYTIAIALSIFAESATAQIEMVFEGNSQGSFSGLVLIDHDMVRYLNFADGNGFELYHLDFSLDMVVTYPEQPSIGGWRPIFITRSLFDCDSTNLEYAVTQTNTTNGGQFRVFGADGSTLLSVDSFAMPQAFISIEDTHSRMFLSDSSGTYIVLHKGISPGGIPAQRVYKLCGQLPQVSMRNAQGSLLGGKPSGKNPNGGFKIYPNPAHEQVRITYDLQGHKRGRLDLFNSQGVLIKQLQLGQASDFVLLDISSLSPGTYIARIASDDGWQLSEKFVRVGM